MHKLALTALALAAFAGVARSQQIVIPLNCTFANPGVSGTTWRATAFKFQMVYDNTLFTGNGVTGPMTINRLRFRAEDGEANLGGQVYSNVSVRLYDTPTTTVTVQSITATGVPTVTNVPTTGIVNLAFASGAADANRSFTLVGTSGANLGVTRFISTNSSTSITVSAGFPVAPIAGDTFDVIRAPITYVNTAQTFAANLGVNVGATETFPTVTVAPASGSFPNDYIIDLPLTASAFVYDPTTMGNLVIEVSTATAPAPNPTALVPFGTSAAAVGRARRNSAATATATAGALSDFGSIVKMDFVGPGGQTSFDPASVVSIGAACNAQSSNIQQYFGNQLFDLANTSLMFTPDNLLAPINYSVGAGATAVDLTKATGLANTSDDALTTHNLALNGWLAPFAYPGGSAVDFLGCTNGFVWLGTTTAATANPTIANWLGGGASNYPARFAACWHDFLGTRNLTTSPLAGMYIATDTIGGPGNAVTYVTWRETGEFNSVAATPGHSVNTFQIAFFEATGQVEMRFGAMNPLTTGCTTGFTRGTLGAGINSTDSGSRNLSHELPAAATGPNGTQGALLLGTSARLSYTQTTTFTAINIPATAAFGAYIYDFNVFEPGLQVPGLLAPGCLLTLQLSPEHAIIQFDLLGGPATTTTPAFGPVPNAPLVFNGVPFYVQYACIDGGTSLWYSSNTLKFVLGNT
ncbi:MAG: hypothetical protein ABL997_07565 [Planctomycetota bacterium]